MAVCADAGTCVNAGFFAKAGQMVPAALNLVFASEPPRIKTSSPRIALKRKHVL